jgi:hypothetical protein
LHILVELQHIFCNFFFNYLYLYNFTLFISYEKLEIK